tara:strand:+ start:3562 stop:5232 length:1671 start_codon:yes stop_codon:yes gene_type:complete
MSVKQKIAKSLLNVGKNIANKARRKAQPPKMERTLSGGQRPASPKKPKAKKPSRAIEVLTKRRRLRDLPKDTARAVVKSPKLVKPAAKIAGKAILPVTIAAQALKGRKMSGDDSYRREVLDSYRGGARGVLDEPLPDSDGDGIPDVFSASNIGRAAMAGLDPVGSAAASFETAKEVLDFNRGDDPEFGPDQGSADSRFNTEFQKQRGQALRDAYDSSILSEIRPADRALFAGAADDAEFKDAEEKRFATAPRSYKAILERQGQQLADRLKREGKVAFGKKEREAFVKAQKSGELVEMFDEDGDGKLSKEERKKFFLAGPEGFVAKSGLATEGLPKMKYTAPRTFAEPITRDAIFGETPPVMLDPSNLEVDGSGEVEVEETGLPPMTEVDVDDPEGGVTPTAIVEELKRKEEEDKKRKRAVELGLRPQDFANDATFLAAIDRKEARVKREAGQPERGSALAGSVGGLNAPSRQLMSDRGRFLKEARALERDGYRTEAGKLRMMAALSREPRIKSQEFRRREAEERRKLREEQERALADKQTNDALVEKGADNIKTLS